MKTLKTSVVRARIDPKIKHEAANVLKNLGMSFSGAISLFFAQVILRKGIPFSVEIPNKKTREAMARLDRGEGKHFKSVEELFNDWEKDEGR